MSDEGAQTSPWGRSLGVLIPSGLVRRVSRPGGDGGTASPTHLGTPWTFPLHGHAATLGTGSLLQASGRDHVRARGLAPPTRVALSWQATARAGSESLPIHSDVGKCPRRSICHAGLRTRGRLALSACWRVETRRIPHAWGAAGSHSVVRPVSHRSPGDQHFGAGERTKSGWSRQSGPWGPRKPPGLARSGLRGLPGLGWGSCGAKARGNRFTNTHSDSAAPVRALMTPSFLTGRTRRAQASWLKPCITRSSTRSNPVKAMI